MRFIGCALAWRPGEANDRTSCLTVLDERGSIIANSMAASIEQIVGYIEGYSAERRGVVVGVDAPLSVPNARGTRRIERVLSKVALPAYSASRKMFGDRPTTYAEDLLAALEEAGIEYTDYPFRRERGQRTVVEVDTAATLKVLLFERGQRDRGGERSSERSGERGRGNGRDGNRDTDPVQRLRNLEDLKFRKGNKESRAAALREAVDVLWNTPGLRLRTGNLSADLTSSENVDLSKLDVTSELSHAELDRVVGLVEATLAAYTVHRHWKGRDGSIVVGTGYEGAVLLPVPQPLQDRLAEECRTAGIPYV